MSAAEAREGAAWPPDGLETLGACPICATAERAVMLEGLTDTIFRTAPGRWTLWRCESCGAGYLDPRPTPQTIHIAYGTYYTHRAAPAVTQARSARQRLRGLAERSYLERHHGLGRGAAAWLGPVVSALRPSLARTLDYYSRYLPRPERGATARVLDVGCGNGAFLRLAASLGWQAFGCDFDPAAVEQARTSGAQVRLGGIETYGECKGRFDAITLSHVIEHVHDPAALLGQARELLRPGGQLFVDTPNFEAAGLRKFGAHWRGLEPPRHLVLFTWRGLRALLEEQGFEQIVDRPQAQVAEGIWKKSDRLRAGKDPYDAQSPYSADALDGLASVAARPVRTSEFVTLTARRAPERP